MSSNLLYGKINYLSSCIIAFQEAPFLMFNPFILDYYQKKQLAEP